MHSATEGFYFQAFNGSVALPVAGYDYNSDWTPLLAGLSPAGMAASLAAPAPFIAALTLSGVKGTERSRTPTASNTALEIGPGQARSALGSLPSSRASPTSRPRSRWSLPRAYGSPML